MNYAEAIEEEGFFDKARRAWQQGRRRVAQFGEQVIEHSTGVKLQLGSQPQLEKKIADLRAKLDAHAARRARRRSPKRSESADARRAPAARIRRTRSSRPSKRRSATKSKRKSRHRSRRGRANRQRATGQSRTKRCNWPAISNAGRQQLQYTINYKHDANYDYWQNRADFEQTPNALEARELMFDAKRGVQESRRRPGETALPGRLRQVAAGDRRVPSILDDEQTTGERHVEFVKGYRDVLDQLDETLGDDSRCGK